jgi:hypothetical protein
VFHIYIYKNTSIIFTLLYPLYLPFPSRCCPTLNMTYFTFLSFIVLVYVRCSVGFCLGILPVNILYFNQSYPSIILPYTFTLPSIVQQFCLHFIVSCSYTDVMYFNIIHSLLLSSSFPPPSVSSDSPTIGNVLHLQYIHTYIYIYTIMLLFVFIFHI